MNIYKKTHSKQLSKLLLIFLCGSVMQVNCGEMRIAECKVAIHEALSPIVNCKRAIEHIDNAVAFINNALREKKVKLTNIVNSTRFCDTSLRPILDNYIAANPEATFANILTSVLASEHNKWSTKVTELDDRIKDLREEIGVLESLRQNTQTATPNNNRRIGRRERERNQAAAQAKAKAETEVEAAAAKEANNQDPTSAASSSGPQNVRQTETVVPNNQAKIRRGKTIHKSIDYDSLCNIAIPALGMQFTKLLSRHHSNKIGLDEYKNGINELCSEIKESDSSLGFADLMARISELLIEYAGQHLEDVSRKLQKMAQNNPNIKDQWAAYIILTFYMVIVKSSQPSVEVVNRPKQEKRQTQTLIATESLSGVNAEIQQIYQQIYQQKSNEASDLIANAAEQLRVAQRAEAKPVQHIKTKQEDSQNRANTEQGATSSSRSSPAEVRPFAGTNEAWKAIQLVIQQKYEFVIELLGRKELANLLSRWYDQGNIELNEYREQIDKICNDLIAENRNAVLWFLDFVELINEIKQLLIYCAETNLRNLSKHNTHTPILVAKEVVFYFYDILLEKYIKALIIPFKKLLEEYKNPSDKDQYEQQINKLCDNLLQERCSEEFRDLIVKVNNLLKEYEPQKLDNIKEELWYSIKERRTRLDQNASVIVYDMYCQCFAPEINNSKEPNPHTTDTDVMNLVLNDPALASDNPRVAIEVSDFTSQETTKLPLEKQSWQPFAGVMGWIRNAFCTLRRKPRVMQETGAAKEVIKTVGSEKAPIIMECYMDGDTFCKAYSMRRDLQQAFPNAQLVIEVEQVMRLYTSPNVKFAIKEEGLVRLLRKKTFNVLTSEEDAKGMPKNIDHSTRGDVAQDINRIITMIVQKLDHLNLNNNSSIEIQFRIRTSQTTHSAMAANITTGVSAEKQSPAIVIVVTTEGVFVEMPYMLFYLKARYPNTQFVKGEVEKLNVPESREDAEGMLNEIIKNHPWLTRDYINNDIKALIKTIDQSLSCARLQNNSQIELRFAIISPSGNDINNNQ